MKHKYRTTQIRGSSDINKIACIDESLIFNDDEDQQIWLIGAIESRIKEIRFDFIKDKTKDTLKKFIYNHIEPGTHIVTNDWTEYSFLDRYESLQTHKVHIHVQGEWGYGTYSTSNIEHT